MRKRTFPITLTRLAMVLGLLVLAPGSARAAEFVDSTIPFGFHAGKADLPAGEYRMAINWDERVLTVQDLKSNKNTAVPFVTTLAKNAPSASGMARVVFDSAGGGYTLSEVWLPEAEGVLVGATPGKHEHKVIMGKH
jgi:hypothetical protein